MKTPTITLGKRRSHSKASEAYIDVVFRYGRTIANWSVPIEYPRTGTHFGEETDAAIKAYVQEVYESCDPARWSSWRAEQQAFWAARNADVTKSFFDVLASDFTWKSVERDLPANRNWARRIQDLKEFGFTIATNTSMPDRVTGRGSTHLLLLPLPRGGITGYETWTAETRARIIELLRVRDAYEGKPGRREGLLPDHKFPECRWDKDTRRSDLSGLSDADISHDFQLLTNQRNQQKREVCRQCLQTGVRGQAFGIAFYYKGDPTWPEDVPKRGKDAERGCVGCAWYDFDAWRDALNSRCNASR